MVEARSTVSCSVAASRGGRRSVAGAIVVLGALLLAACATSPPRPPTYPVAVELGPVIRLFDVSTSSEQVQALIDDAGLGHVLVASPRSRTLRHVAVDREGAVSLDEIVRSDVNPASLDAAFDAAGRLHVLAGPQHLVRELTGEWSEAPTPWAAANLETTAPRFVHGGDRDRPLLFAFDVRGKEVGAPARWDIYGIGGSFGAGLIWPWRTRGSRLAVVAEDGGRYDAWAVVDLDDNEDVADWQVVADPEGHVHVVYDAQRAVLAVQSLARYACIEPASEDTTPVREIAGRHVRAVSGMVVPVTPEAPSIGLSAALAFDASSGELLLVRQHFGGRALRDGTWGPEVLFPLPLAFEPRVAPVAAGRFDVVISGSKSDSTSGNERPVFYLQFRDGRWSVPVEIGGAKMASFFGWTWDAVQIASDGREHVLVTWPVPRGIEARWLRVAGRAAP